jgi:hypothetical protein
MSLNADWYVYDTFVPKPVGKLSLLFWKKDKLPITETDKQWTENALLLLTELFEPVFFRSLVTITPDKKYFDHNFTGAEMDAKVALDLLTDIMHINPWEIQLMFYSNSPTKIANGITATPQENLKGGWNTSTGKYVDNGLGHKEIWVEMEQLYNAESLIGTLARQLAIYKLSAEYQIKEDIEALADLTAIVFGLGIFIGNSYFKFKQWTGNTHSGWRMQKSGYLPEQMVAYAMAWLSHYKNEEIVWKRYLNKTIKKYFEQSYEYIEQNKDMVRWD